MGVTQSKLAEDANSDLVKRVLMVPYIAQCLHGGARSSHCKIQHQANSRCFSFPVSLSPLNSNVASVLPSYFVSSVWGFQNIPSLDPGKEDPNCDICLSPSMLLQSSRIFESTHVLQIHDFLQIITFLQIFKFLQIFRL